MTKHRPPALPDPLELKKHLDSCTATELADFLRFWSPHEESADGRAWLVQRLFELMSDENVVYAKVDLLSEKVRVVLLQLLRKMHYTSDLQGLFRGIDGLEMEHYEAEAALTALARRGFVRASRAQERLQYGRSSYAIPLETALVMRGLAGTDRRPLDHVFVHETFQPSSVEAAAAEPYAPLPESVPAAIESLPNVPLRKVAKELIERYGGILTRHEFGEVFRPSRIAWNSGRFLREFGKRGLGTVGHLDLRAKGIAVDDDAVLLYSEAVERYFREQREEKLEHDRVLTAHGDLMSDVGTALVEVKDVPVKVAKEGSVYKSARARLAERLQFLRQPWLEREEVADKVITVLRGLELAVDCGEGQLVVSEAGEAWRRRPLLEKLKDAYALLLTDGAPTVRSHHMRRVHAIVIELLTGDENPDGWWPGRSLALLARNRYLLELVKDDGPEHRGTLTTRAALTELGAAAHDLVTRDLFALGLVDVAVQVERAVGVRLSRLGRRLLLDDPAAPAEKPLVVNPDFELMVLPEGDVDDLLHELDRFAARERAGEVVHYRLDRSRIERAAVDGESPEEILEFLEAHSRAPLPQNVSYSIGSWGGNVRSATLERGVLFVANDAAIVEAILSHPTLKEFVTKVVDPTTVLFDEKATERRIAQELRALGVYVR